MSSLKSLAFAAAAATFLSSVVATFNAAANSNMAVYWVGRIPISHEAATDNDCIGSRTEPATALPLLR